MDLIAGSRSRIIAISSLIYLMKRITRFPPFHNFYTRHSILICLCPLAGAFPAIVPANTVRWLRYRTVRSKAAHCTYPSYFLLEKPDGSELRSPAVCPPHSYSVLRTPYSYAFARQMGESRAVSAAPFARLPVLFQ